MSVYACDCVSLVHGGSGKIHTILFWGGKTVHWGKGGVKGDFALICNVFNFLQEEYVYVLFLCLTYAKIFPRASTN